MWSRAKAVAMPLTLWPSGELADGMAERRARRRYGRAASSPTVWPSGELADGMAERRGRAASEQLACSGADGEPDRGEHAERELELAGRTQHGDEAGTG